MLAVSQQFKDALNVSHQKVSEFTVTTPDDVETALRVTSARVSSGNDSGTRYTASLDVVPQPGIDLYSILSTPGAVYRIRHGIDFGYGEPELVDMGVYEASQGSINIIDGSISISLVDRWICLERARLAAPAEVDGSFYASRADLIGQIVEAAFITGFAPDGVDIRAEGGQFFDVRVWERDRTQIIKDMATDGELDCYFDASGVFVIREQPIIDLNVPTVWTFRTGPSANIFTAERERPFDRLYNVVVVSPIDEEQTWEAQAAGIADVTHPRHQDNLGQLVPYFYSSPTLSDANAALSAAETILQRVLGTTETVSIGALGNPALEVGDMVTIAHQATPSDPGFNSVHMIDGWDYDLGTGAMTLKTRSGLENVEEA